MFNKLELVVGDKEDKVYLSMTHPVYVSVMRELVGEIKMSMPQIIKMSVNKKEDKVLLWIKKGTLAPVYQFLGFIVTAIEHSEKFGLSDLQALEEKVKFNIGLH